MVRDVLLYRYEQGGATGYNSCPALEVDCGKKQNRMPLGSALRCRCKQWNWPAPIQSFPQPYPHSFVLAQSTNKGKDFPGKHMAGRSGRVLWLRLAVPAKQLR
jgi:hypothetical protein